MHELYLQYIRSHTEWLSCVVFEYKLFYYDLWSFVHMWSGAMVFVILTAYKFKKRWLKLLFWLSIFEVFEATIIIAGFHIFKPEKSVDVVNDIINGMLGGYLMYRFFKWDSKKNLVVWFAAIISGLTVAFVWVGSYGYHYNIPYFNSPCLNWWAFLCWTLGGIAIIFVFNVFKGRMNVFFAFLFTWMIHFAFLFSVEYFAYHVLTFREVTKGTTPLIFDIIHGNRSMHIFYSMAPVFFIGLFLLFLSLFKKYEKAQNA